VLLGVFLVIAVELLGIRSLSFAVGAYLSIATRWPFSWRRGALDGRPRGREKQGGHGRRERDQPGIALRERTDCRRRHRGLLGVALKLYEPPWGEKISFLLPATNPLHHDWVSVVMFGLLAFSLYYFARKPLKT